MPGFHTLAAHLQTFSPLELHQTIRLTVHLFIIFYILGIYSLVLKLTENKKCALLSAFWAAAWFHFPYSLFTWGGWAQIAGFALVPTVVCLLLTSSWRNLVLAIIVLIIQFYIHATGAIWSLIFAFSIAAVFEKKMRWLLFSIIATIVIALIMLFLYFNVQNSIDLTEGKSIVLEPFGEGIKKLKQFMFPAGILDIPSFFCAFIGFFVIFFSQKKLRGILLFGTITILLIVFRSNLLRPVFETTYPWLEISRSVYPLTLVASICAGCGSFLFFRFGKFKDVRGLFFLLCGIGTLIVVFLTTSYFYPKRLRTAHKQGAPIQNSDIECVNWLKTNGKSNDVVITDIWCCHGNWIAETTPLKPLIYYQVRYPFHSSNLIERIQLKSNLLKLNPDNSIIKKAVDMDVRYIFVTSHSVKNRREYSFDDLIKLSNTWSLVFSTNNNYIFEIKK